METKKQNYTLPIIVMIFLFGMISFVTNLASPMGDILKYQFNVPNWMGTLGVFANFIAYAIMGYPAGNMLQKYGYKKTALVAIAVGFTGVGIQTLSGSVESFGVYLLGAFIAGFSMCLLNTVVNPMLNKLGGGGNKGNQLIQAGGSFNSLCGTAVIILTGLLIPEGIKNAQISNVFPLMYGALAIFAFAFIVIALTKIPETQKTEGKKVAETSKYSPLSFRHFILGSVAIFVYVGVEVGVPNVLQKWLQNPELNVLGSGVNVEAIAGSVAATYWLLMLVGRLLGAMIGSKVSAKSMLMVVSSAGLLLTLGAGLATGIGSAIAFFARRTNKRLLSFSLGLSGGVMIYVSFVELFQQAHATLSDEWGAQTGIIVTVASFFAGILLIGIIDRLVPSFENPHEAHMVEEMDKQPRNPKLMRMGVMTALAIGIHNFPEGIATFTSAVDNMALGVAIAAAIAIHNIPEGIAVSIPVYYATGDRKKAFKLSLLSGLAEPVGAVLAYLVLMPFMTPTLMGCILAGVAGIMVFISIDELLPAAREYGEAHISIYGVVAGMALMAVSLIILG